VPGLKRFTGCAGQAGLTSDQLVVSAAKSLASSSRVTPSGPIQSLPGLTTTARASVPTRNSMGSRPMARQLSISLRRMGREALAMSVSPAAEALEAGAGADGVDGDVAAVALVAEALGHALGQREDRRAARHDDVARGLQRVDLAAVRPMQRDSMGCAAGRAHGIQPIWRPVSSACSEAGK
jgi:hypothetical protein